jgi:hypothetical protein
MRKLIGLTGKAGVGKTTLAEYFSDNEKFKIMSYATPLKEALSVMTGEDISLFTDHSLKEQEIKWIGRTPRQIMQLFGTDFVRDMIHPDFWVLRMKQELLKSQDDIIIDDIRFDNEADLVRELGGLVIHMNRNTPFSVFSNHKSEKPIKFKIGSDKYLDCNCTKAEAYQTASAFVKIHYLNH